jgi:putative ABC transport system permease protein
MSVDTGFRTDGVLVVQMFAWDRNSSPAARRTFFDRATAQAAAIPGIERVGLVGAMPFIESNIDIRGVVQLLDQPKPAPGDEPRASLNVATPGYFEVMRIPLLRGRHLLPSDGPDAPRVTVISEAMATRLFGDVDPIGQRLAFRYSGQPMQVEVAGIVGATRHERLDEPLRAELFLPHAQVPSGSMTLVARAAIDPAPLVESVKAAIWTIDPLQTFYRTATLTELVERTVTTRRFALVVLTGFAALALLLAAAGLYGVLSTIVSQYRREIGVRMALGAAWTDILRLVVGRGLGVAAAGVAIGLVGVLGGARVLRGYLFSVAPTDPVSLGGAAGLVLLVAALACYLPAKRAADGDPCEALRVE